MIRVFFVLINTATTTVEYSEKCWPRHR